MGFRLYKRVSLGKGIRLNHSKTGVGISGTPGIRHSVHSSVRIFKTVRLPGTGSPGLFAHLREESASRSL